MNRKWLVPGIIIGVIVLLGMIVVGGYNGLVGQRETVSAKLGDLEARYQLRYDLVPNLVNTVKGAADFEQETLTAVVEARAKATSVTLDPSNATPEQLAEYQQSQGELSQALGRLLAVTENYPELKAVAAFQDLQNQLEGIENKISVARIDYNDVVRVYNTRIQQFPTNITASLFGFEKAVTFNADDGAQDAPAVDFE